MTNYTMICTNYAATLLDATSCDCLYDAVTDFVNEVGGDYDIEAITAEYRAAIVDVLPDTWRVHGEDIYAPAGTDPADVADYRDGAKRINFWTIANKHEIETDSSNKFDPEIDILRIAFDASYDLSGYSDPDYPAAVEEFETAWTLKIKEIAESRGIDVRVVHCFYGDPESAECDGDSEAEPGTADYIAAELWQDAHDHLFGWTPTPMTADKAAAMIESEYGFEAADITAAVDSCIDAGLELDQPDDGNILTGEEIQTIIDQLHA